MAKLTIFTLILGLFILILGPNLAWAQANNPKPSSDSFSTAWQGFIEAKWAVEANLRLKAFINQVLAKIGGRWGYIQEEAKKEVIEMAVDIQRQWPQIQENFQKIKNWIKETITEIKKR